MQWVDLTDALFFRAFDYLFVIEKEPKIGVHDWRVIKDGNVVFSGCNRHVGAAKSACKEIYKTLKAEQPLQIVYNTKTNKLRRKRA